MAIAFAGPLSRWFGHDAAEAARLRAGVEAWREDLRRAVAAKVGSQLVWDEGSAFAERFDLGEAGLTALRLFAFYAERSDLEFPDTTPPLCELDPEWRTAADAKFPGTLYGQILACEMWLPGDFPVTLRAPRPDGQAVEIGSLGVLRDQLRWLNERTFQADGAVLAGWRTLPAPPGASLLGAAQRGFAALLAAAEAARGAGVPLTVAVGSPPSATQD